VPQVTLGHYWRRWVATGDIPWDKREIWHRRRCHNRLTLGGFVRTLEVPPYKTGTRHVLDQDLPSEVHAQAHYRRTEGQLQWPRDGWAQPTRHTGRRCRRHHAYRRGFPWPSGIDHDRRLTGEPRTATVVADTECVVYALSPRDFASLLARCPRLAKQVASVAMRRLTETAA